MIPLHVAAEKGCFRIAEYLLGKDVAAINITDNSGVNVSFFPGLYAGRTKSHTVCACLVCTLKVTNFLRVLTFKIIVVSAKNAKFCALK